MGLIHLFFCLKCIPDDVKLLTKTVKINVVILFCVVLYAILGGYVFYQLEHTAAEETQENGRMKISQCIEKMINNVSLGTITKQTSLMIVWECFPEDRDFRTHWSWTVATLYGFGILTTLGYGRIEPMTTNGRLFCVIFGLIGMPVMMLTLANFGKYLNEFGPKLRKKLAQFKSYVTTKIGSLSNLNQSDNGEDSDDDDDFEINPLLLFVLLIVYVLAGAAFLPLLSGRFDFANGVYFTFLCLTAIEFGVLVPENIYYLPITLLYICVGLMITSITIEFGADYVKKLHYLGRKIANCRVVRVWFGGKTLQVNELLHAVGKNWGVDSEIMDDINLEEIVDTAIKVKEGKLPPGTYVRRPVHGIWPPELVPILVRDGGVPLYVDDPESVARQNSMFAMAPPLFATEESLKLRASFGQVPIHTPSLMPSSSSTQKQKKLGIVPFIDR